MARRKLTKAQKSAFREGMFFGWNKHRKALRKHKYKFKKTSRKKRWKKKRSRGKYTSGTKVYRLMKRPKIEYAAAPTASYTNIGSYI